MKVYRCKECGKVWDAEDKSNIGYAHAHVQKHKGVLGFRIPFTEKFVLGASIDELDDCLEVVRVLDSTTHEVAKYYR